MLAVVLEKSMELSSFCVLLKSETLFFESQNASGIFVAVFVLDRLLVDVPHQQIM